MTYTDRGSWAAMTSGSEWLFDNFADFPGQLVISQGLVPDTSPEDMSACARGEHDDDWRAFGQLMVRRGRASSIVRLGWEFNGDFSSGAATDTEIWKACYRSAALAIRHENPLAQFDWTITAHETAPEICDGSSIHCYPGDDVVDVIGIDNYDMGPSATSQADFDAIAAAPDGLDWLFDFAQKHGKPFSVGEWAVAPGSDSNTTGDNAQFVRSMHAWFSAHADSMAYEAYFNHCETGEIESNLYRPTGRDCVRKNVEAASVYRSLWAATGTAADPGTLEPSTR